MTKTKEIFFTQGNKFCGVAFRLGDNRFNSSINSSSISMSISSSGTNNDDDDEDFTPCISLGALREVKANFGEEDFVFDIYSYLKSREIERQKEIHQVFIPFIQV